MKKSIILIVTLIFTGTILFPNTASAADFSKYPRTSVYCSGNEQSAVYEVLQKEWDYSSALEGYGLEIVKESITPVYVIDTIDYAITGELKVEPESTSYYGAESKHKYGNVYIAKTVTVDGLFGGNIEFFVENDIAHSLGFSPSLTLAEYFTKFQAGYYDASCSYADHARRIQELLNRDDFVPVENVKYVLVNGWGPVFYINDGENEYFVSIGDESTKYTNGTDRVIYMDEFKENADIMLAKKEKAQAEREAWEKEHPGEVYTRVGGGVSMQISTTTHNVDNILNISEYLNIDLSVDPELEQAIAAQTAADNQTTTTNNYKWIYIVSCIAVITAVCTAIVISKKRKGV